MTGRRTGKGAIRVEDRGDRLHHNALREADKKARTWRTTTARDLSSPWDVLKQPRREQ